MESQTIKLDNPFRFVKFYETDDSYYYATSDGRVLQKSRINHDEHYLAIHDYQSSKVVNIGGRKFFLKDIIISSFFSQYLNLDYKIYFADGNPNNLNINNIWLFVSDYKKILDSDFEKGNRLNRKKIK